MNENKIGLNGYERILMDISNKLSIVEFHIKDMERENKQKYAKQESKMIALNTLEDLKEKIEFVLAVK